MRCHTIGLCCVYTTLPGQLTVAHVSSSVAAQLHCHQNYQVFTWLQVVEINREVVRKAFEFNFARPKPILSVLVVVVLPKISR